LAYRVQSEEPFKVIVLQAKPGPAQSLKPFGDGIERSSYVPHGKVDRGTFVCQFKLVKEVEDGCVCTSLPSKAMLVGMKDVEVLPDVLYPPGNHTRPHLADDLKQ
jgi:hypothetical protein